MHYRKIYEQHYQCSLLPGIEIHHIDGNSQNNDPSNLLAVTIEEHLAIHKAQGDWGAVQAILMRMEQIDREEISHSARKKQTKLIQEGNHNFQKMSKERRTEISQKAGIKTRDLGIGVHHINQNPDLAKKNAKKGGIASQLKRRDPDFAYLNKLQGLAVKNTKWYYNQNTKEKVRSNAIPEGDGWIEGMGPVMKKPDHKTVKNYCWWYNTETKERKRSCEVPAGKNWIKGFIKDDLNK